MDLSDFYAESKSSYVAYLETKKDNIQFSLNAIKNPNYLYLFQKRGQEK